MTHATPRTRARRPTSYRIGRRWWQLLALLLLSLLSAAAAAQTRAWLDRDRIGAGETVTLNIEASGASSAPDYTPLQQDFTISGNTSSRQLKLVNGRSSSHTLYAVALRPRREGVLTIPALAVGNQRTQPLALVVTPASAQVPARAGDDVFVESEADDLDPYLQQSVGWVVRLYSAVPLVSGQLDQGAPEGASLQQVGDDAQYSRQIDGRRYQVVERRYLLIPERSGTLTIPGATFEGRGAAGFFDDFLGNGRSGVLRASAAPRFLHVRPVPAKAPQPWLPLHGLTLRYQSAPQVLQAGAAATLTVEATADGASASQMPDLQLPPIAGVQVFAEPVQVDETFSDGRPRVKLTRQFSLVPTRGGPVTLDGMQLGWWDVRSGAAQTATLPALEWTVAPAVDQAGTAAGPSVAAGAAVPPAPDASRAAASRGWVLAALLFAALWLLTLIWGLRQRTPPMRPVGDTAAAGASATTAGRPATGTGDLKRALATGDFGEIGDLLCAMARPPARDLDEVRARLQDPAQRGALDAMQHARWGGGDGVAARARLREAFAIGPRWQTGLEPAPSPLPPLYPPG